MEGPFSPRIPTALDPSARCGTGAVLSPKTNAHLERSFAATIAEELFAPKGSSLYAPRAFGTAASLRTGRVPSLVCTATARLRP